MYLFVTSHILFYTCTRLTLQIRTVLTTNEFTEIQNNTNIKENDKNDSEFLYVLKTFLGFLIRTNTYLFIEYVIVGDSWLS